MSRPTGDVTNWMHLFRWIVKLIRDEYGIEEARLTRHAALEGEIGLGIEQVEEVMSTISTSFAIRFPEDTLNEVLRLEELCLVAAWMKGLYKQPDFVSAGFAAACRGANPGLA
jgi:hypothetical protein